MDTASDGSAATAFVSSLLLRFICFGNEFRVLLGPFALKQTSDPRPECREVPLPGSKLADMPLDYDSISLMINFREYLKGLAMNIRLWYEANHQTGFSSSPSFTAPKFFLSYHWAGNYSNYIKGSSIRSNIQFEPPVDQSLVRPIGRRRLRTK